MIYDDIKSSISYQDFWQGQRLPLRPQFSKLFSITCSALTAKGGTGSEAFQT